MHQVMKQHPINCYFLQEKLHRIVRRFYWTDASYVNMKLQDQSRQVWWSQLCFIKTYWHCRGPFTPRQNFHISFLLAKLTLKKGLIQRKIFAAISTFWCAQIYLNMWLLICKILHRNFALVWKSLYRDVVFHEKWVYVNLFQTLSILSMFWM